MKQWFELYVALKNICKLFPALNLQRFLYKGGEVFCLRSSMDGGQLDLNQHFFVSFCDRNYRFENRNHVQSYLQYNTVRSRGEFNLTFAPPPPSEWKEISSGKRIQNLSRKRRGKKGRRGGGNLLIYSGYVPNYRLIKKF